MSYLANFQHPEAGFQFMTILPLIRKQRWRKIVWAENSLGLSLTELQSLGVPGQAPPQQHDQLTTPGSAPLLYLPLTRAHSYAAPVPSARCDLLFPPPHAFAHSRLCRNVCPSLPSDAIFPARPCPKATLRCGLLPPTTSRPQPSPCHSPPLKPWGRCGATGNAHGETSLSSSLNRRLPTQSRPGSGLLANL